MGKGAVHVSRKHPAKAVKGTGLLKTKPAKMALTVPWGAEDDAFLRDNSDNGRRFKLCAETLGTTASACRQRYMRLVRDDKLKAGMVARVMHASRGH